MRSITNNSNVIDRDELVNSIDFTEEDYQQKDTNTSFDEFIDQVISDCRENNGAIEDAVFEANDAYSLLKDKD
nr:hypothetical protein [uncultured Prevotella sp.]